MGLQRRSPALTNESVSARQERNGRATTIASTFLLKGHTLLAHIGAKQRIAIWKYAHPRPSDSGECGAIRTSAQTVESIFLRLGKVVRPCSNHASPTGLSREAQGL